MFQKINKIFTKNGFCRPAAGQATAILVSPLKYDPSRWRQGHVFTTSAHGTNKRSRKALLWGGDGRRWSKATRPRPIAGLPGRVRLPRQPQPAGMADRGGWDRDAVGIQRAGQWWATGCPGTGPRKRGWKGHVGGEPILIGGENACAPLPPCYTTHCTQ